MASSCSLKELHHQYLDPDVLIETYFAKESAFLEDTSLQLFPLVCKAFSSGPAKGELLIAMSMVPFFQFALPACDYFRDIYLACSTEKCISAVEKWWRNSPEATDWSHALKATCETEGNREAWTEKQMKFQKTIKQLLQYDVIKSNPFSPTILPPADCLLLVHCLECHVTDKEAFCSAFKNVLSMLKNGGILIMIMVLEQTFYMLGGFKFPHLCIDENFLKKALHDADCVIEELRVLPRRVRQLHDMADYSSIAFVHARKQIPA